MKGIIKVIIVYEKSFSYFRINKPHSISWDILGETKIHEIQVKQEYDVGRNPLFELKAEPEIFEDNKDFTWKILEQSKLWNGEIVASAKSIKHEDVELSENEIDIADEGNGCQNRTSNSINTKDVQDIPPHFLDINYRTCGGAKLKNLESEYDAGEKSYRCDLCEYAAYHKRNLELHIYKIHLETKIFSCEQCDYKTNYTNHLRNHINSSHLQIKHQCHLCSYSSKWKTTLKSHISSVHTEGEIYTCDHCNYSTNRKSYLKIHMNRVHLKIKKHLCNLCDYKTSQKGNLKRHMVSVHAEVKNHKCTLCNFRTKDKYNIKNTWIRFIKATGITNAKNAIL
ncbi:hypothetical protein HHI36_020692 [Cryptolaemus montrouzieri]|uniref:C2H2-type domain-containing protein n=1 Tax=Cryptolaemus montrouzieri TaxID=559131 RepID=A0ABD2NC55_9CUCU